MCVVFIGDASRRELEEVRPRFLKKGTCVSLDRKGASKAYVFSNDKESNTIRPLSVLLCVCLCTCDGETAAISPCDLQIITGRYVRSAML